jgi:hypothetical protein
MTRGAEIIGFDQYVAYRSNPVGPQAKPIRLLPGVALLLLFVSALGGCGGGSSPRTTQVPPPVNPMAIPATFFSMSDTSNNSPPAVNYGTLGHPVQGGWETMEPTKGAFDFSFFDGYVNMAPQDSDGSNTALVIITLSKTPPWALSLTEQASCTPSGGTATVGCTLPPDNIQDWKDFVTALMQHYNGTTKPHVKYYEIWNEADSGVYWTGTISQLAALSAAAYPIIKQDSHSFVITPSMVGSPGPTFLTKYLQAGGSQSADIASFHGYIAPMAFPPPYPLPTGDCSAPCGGPITDQMTAYRQVLDNNGMQGKPLINTEGGFYNSTITDADTAAAWLAQYYALQAGEFTNLNVQVVTWWLWGGLVVPGSPDTGPNAPSEVGIAFTQAYNWMVGATFSAPCSNTGPIWTCNITRSGGYQAQITWDASQSCSLGTCTTSIQTVPATYTQYRDLAGDPAVSISGQVAVGLKPIILEN